MSTLEQAVGAADARRLWDFAAEGLQLQRDLIATHAIDCDYTPGHMILGLKRRHDASLRAEIEHLESQYDYHSLRLIGRDELRDTHRERALSPAPCSTRTGVTCTPTATRWAWAARPRRPACRSSKIPA